MGQKEVEVKIKGSNYKGKVIRYAEGCIMLEFKSPVSSLALNRFNLADLLLGACSGDIWSAVEVLRFEEKEGNVKDA